MSSPDQAPITQLLRRWTAGEKECLDELIRLVERDLRRIAHHHMRNERQGHSLQTTALVNEAYLKLIEKANVNWQERAQFFAIAAGLMRRILVDHARGVRRVKRGGAVVHVQIDENLVYMSGESAELIALDDALSEFEKQHPRQARVVELRYFGGLSVEEAAEAQKVHANTIIRDWSFAKAWLAHEIRHRGADSGTSKSSA